MANGFEPKFRRDEALPLDAVDGRVSIVTPIGAALYGLRASSIIDWPDVAGNSRRLRILKVVQPRIGDAA